MSWPQFLALTDAYGPTVATIIILALAFFFVYKMWKPISQFVTSVNTVASLPDKLKAIDTSLAVLTTGQQTIAAEQAALREDVGHIKHEVQTNGGGSMKDAVRNTERGIKSLQGTVRQMSGRVTAIERGQKLAADVADQRAS